MKIKLSETTRLQIDWLVAKCEGVKLHPMPQNGVMEIHFSEPNGCLPYSPSTDPSQAYPIIDRERIGTHAYRRENGMAWRAVSLDGSCKQYGPTLLVAAMRCYVASKLGVEVEVPNELA